MPTGLSSLLPIYVYPCYFNIDVFYVFVFFSAPCFSRFCAPPIASSAPCWTGGDGAQAVLHMYYICGYVSWNPAGSGREGGWKWEGMARKA